MPDKRLIFGPLGDLTDVSPISNISGCADAGKHFEPTFGALSGAPGGSCFDGECVDDLGHDGITRRGAWNDGRQRDSQWSLLNLRAPSAQLRAASTKKGPDLHRSCIARTRHGGGAVHRADRF